jgi:hypothetical protein
MMAIMFRKPRQPFIPGELRLKTWRSLEPNVTADDKRWLARCQQYWTLQARLYGVVFSPFVMLVDNKDGMISTYATVTALIPGERTDDYSQVPIKSTEVDSVE